ncbi:SRPBCC family protein [Flavobacterium hercynium]|uniref:Cyclase n=1 Tax=Flavobacterium hercynium TaxID=387094 RepID=A0A226H5Q5_9FLAO|nr:SRPBCC family protein [Flavobacterium hercynium]OXA89522.1 cyclase [Flavobacterium hercynium]SMP35944.1 Uncharacterized membrane protein [Flavobacterium hercynium]
METKSTSKSTANVSTLERILMVTSGSYLLYKGLAQENKSLAQISSGGAMLARGISGYCPIYNAVDHLKNDKPTNVNIRTSIVINRPISYVYSFWRNLENLPKFMNHLASVKTISDTQSEWTVKGPGGIGTLSWNAEIIKDRKEKVISWQSLPNAPIKNFGKVLFKAQGYKTEIEVMISYRAPLGIAGESAAKLLNPYFEKMVNDDIKNLQVYMESIH